MIESRENVLVGSTSEVQHHLRVPDNVHATQRVSCVLPFNEPSTTFGPTTTPNTMPDRPPFPGRPAQPPGSTYLQYSPDGQRLIVAGVGNFARSFRTGDNGEPDLLPETHEETYAVASGV